MDLPGDIPLQGSSRPLPASPHLSSPHSGTATSTHWGFELPSWAAIFFLKNCISLLWLFLGFVCLFGFFWPHRTACGILVP